MCLVHFLWTLFKQCENRFWFINLVHFFQCCLSGMEPWNLAVYTDTNRAHICCDVCSLLGPIPSILFLGQNCEGWFHKIYWLYVYYWLYVSSEIIIWFLQVWYATESGNLEVTYTHNEEHVCIILFTFPLDTWFYYTMMFEMLML